MDFKDLIKSIEGMAVLGGLLLTVLFGKLFAWITAIVYILINVPALWNKIKEWFNSLKSGDTN